MIEPSVPADVLETRSLRFLLLAASLVAAEG